MSVAGYLLLAILALTPVAVAPGFLLYFDITPKVAVLVAGIGALLWFCNPLSEPAIRSTHRLRLCLLAQWLSLVVSTIASLDPAISLTGGTWRRFGLITQTALLLWCWKFADEWLRSAVLRRWFFRVMTVVSIALFAVGLAQYGLWITADSFSMPPWEAKRAYGTLGHPVYFGNYMLAPAFLCLAEAWQAPDRIWKILGWIGATCATAAIVLSGTRSSLLGLLVGAAVLGLVRKQRFRLRHGVAILGIMACLAVFYVSPPGLPWRNRIRQWSLDTRGGTRLLLWQDSIRMFLAEPWIGHGPDSFTRAFPKYQSQPFARAFPDSYHESPHNMFLDAAVEQGSVGVLALLALVALAVYSCRQAMPAERTWPAILLGAMAAILVAHQFACFTVPNALDFYLIVALSASIPGHEKLLTAGKRHAGGLRILECTGAAVMLLFVLRLTIADWAMGRVKYDLGAGEVTQAMKSYRMARKWQPGGFSADLWYSRALLASGDRFDRLDDVIGEATAGADRATVTAEDRPNAYYHAGLVYFGRNDWRTSESRLHEALQCAPYWYKPYWLLAHVLEVTGRYPEAASAAETAASLSGGKPEIQQYLRETQARIRNK